MNDISIEDRIEAARARLKTAYNRWLGAPADLKQSCETKWQQRKNELNILLTNNHFSILQ